MKSEKEVRELIGTLQLLSVQPCDCLLRGPAHTYKCLVGDAAMKAVILNLKWTVGDAEDKQSTVDRMNEAAAKIRHDNKERANKRKGK